MRAGYWDSTEQHAWVNTNECLRNADGRCVNMHINCMWFEGHECKCTHKADYKLSSKGYDSPLRRRSKP